MPDAPCYHAIIPVPGMHESAKRLESFRTFYANLITAHSGPSAQDDPLKNGFATPPRGRFLGEGPWKVGTSIGYIETPANDPALLYQDITVALQPEHGINNGQPSLHALCLAALHVQKGETVVHVGAGTGYYT